MLVLRDSCTWHLALCTLRLLPGGEAEASPYWRTKNAELPTDN